jgi:hypothetical protein
MPKQFVPGTSVRALCKTAFGDKIAKNLHGDQWKTSTVQGVILPQLLGGKKVLVEWNDPQNNLHKVSEHGPQAFITTDFAAPATVTSAAGGSAVPAVAMPSAQPQNRANFSHPMARPRFQIPLRRVDPVVPTGSVDSTASDQQPVASTSEQESHLPRRANVDVASADCPPAVPMSEPHPAGGIDVGASESDSDDTFSDKAEEDPELEGTGEEHACQAGPSPQQPTAPAADNPLLCHGLQWRPVDGIVRDVGHHPDAWTTRLEWPSDLDAPSLHNRTTLDYWLLMQPACMREVLLNTNELFIAHSMKPVTPSELLTFYGCVFAIALYGGRVGKRRDHWSEPTPSTKFPGLNLGRWMGVRRFEDLLCNMVWGYARKHPRFDAEDLWWPVRQLLDSFNAHRKQVVRPERRERQ